MPSFYWSNLAITARHAIVWWNFHTIFVRTTYDFLLAVSWRRLDVSISWGNAAAIRLASRLRADSFTHRLGGGPFDTTVARPVGASKLLDVNNENDDDKNHYGFLYMVVYSCFINVYIFQVQII